MMYKLAPMLEATFDRMDPLFNLTFGLSRMESDQTTGVPRVTSTPTLAPMAQSPSTIAIATVVIGSLETKQTGKC
jgi:hypothetical protein